MFLRDYYIQCLTTGYIPFNGSLIKLILFSLLLGVFTTWTCICSFVVVIWQLLCEICKK